MKKIAVILIAAVLTGPVAAQDKSATYPKMAQLEQYRMADRDAEIALARSAAPASISSDATVLVLTRKGYETAVKGKNGFVCLVDRSWQDPFTSPEFWNPRLQGPTCFNPQAVRSVLPLQLKRTEWALAGLSKEEILARVKTAIEKKEVGPPEIGAMSYMMSRHQHLSGVDDPHFQPHVMFYMPNTLMQADWGAELLGAFVKDARAPANLPKSPVILLPADLPGGGRSPVNIFVVPVQHWSDGTAAPGHKQNDHRKK